MAGLAVFDQMETVTATVANGCCCARSGCSHADNNRPPRSDYRDSLDDGFTRYPPPSIDMPVVPWSNQEHAPLAQRCTRVYQVCTCHMCSSGSLLPELLGEPDENSFRAPDVAEPIRVLILNHFADQLRAAFAEPGERIADVLHGEHDA